MSNPLAIIGKTTETEQGKVKSWSQTSGESVTRTWRGPIVAMQSLYETMKVVAGFDPTYDGVELDEGRGIGTIRVLVVEDGGVTYELIHNDMTKDLAEAPYFANADDAGAALTFAQIAAAKEELQNLTDPAATTFTGKQLSYYKHLIMGITEYHEAAYVLRLSQIVSKRSTVVASYTNVNKVVSLPDGVAVANKLLGSLPDSGEWLKRAPDVRKYGKRKWEISQEYWWANKWSQQLYGGTWNLA